MYSTVLKNYFNENERLLNTEDFYDVKIYVGVESNFKEVHAHASIISAHCPFFNNALSNATKEDGYYIIKKVNICEKYFNSILKFLYTCKFEFEKYSGYEILELLISADQLGIESLCEYMMNYFIGNHEDYIKENPVKILQLIYTNEKFKELENIYLENFYKYSEKLFESSEFKSLGKPILLEILERNDFFVDEVVIWENILEWGLAKHPEINNINVENWPLQNFIDLGSTLGDFLSLIRFQDISKEYFFDEIEPYQMLFPRTLWKPLSQYYFFPKREQSINLLPSRILNFNSKLDSLTINQNLILLFASHIDGKSSSYTSFNEVKYEFKLIYRSSRDGLDAKVFHQKCDNINKTLVVSKMQNSEQIVGGYNPLDWNGQWSSYKNIAESFIFNISSRNIVSLSYVINSKFAVLCGASFLPIFGKGDLSYCADGTISVSVNTYKNINIVSEIKFDDLEVFQVIDKKLK